METTINNCGLIALRNVSSMKDVSVRTLINLAEDNGLDLFAYSLSIGEADQVKLPAIFYKDNHFEFIDNKELIDKYKDSSCVVLLQERANFDLLENVKSVVGATWVAVGVGGALLVGGSAGAGTTGNKKVSKQIKKMPKYKINEEAFQNQSMARSRAFGRDRSVQMAQEDLESQAAEDVSRAQDVSDSTSGLLSTIAAINANTTAGKRELAQDEATIQRQNIGDLYQVNKEMIDEKDKEWYQNKYAPWEAKLQAIRDKQANNRKLFGSIAGVGGNILGGALGGGKS